jgi:hypothetical protein
VASGETTLAGKTTVSNNLSVTGTIETPKLTANTTTIQQTLNVKKAEGTSDPAVATIDKAVIDDIEVIESLTVGTGKFSVTGDAAGFTVPVNVTNNVTIDGENYVKTPTLDVKTIKNDGTEAVTVDDDLTIKGNLVLDVDKAVVADTVNVNRINSRTTDDEIVVNSPVKLDNTFKVTNEAILQNNLKVADNLNVGNLTAAEMKEADNGGYIVAKQDIIAKHDLIAENDATVENNLTVNNHTKTKILEATDIQIKDQGQVPALELYHFKTGSYQLRFKFNTELAISEEK